MRWLGLSEDGSTVTLRRFDGSFRLCEPSGDGAALKKGVVLDCETTGLDKGADRVIEIGIRPFSFETPAGRVVAVGEGYSGLEDPGSPLSEAVRRITGLSEDDLRGREIDWTLVRTLVGGADVVVAHNASFDRPFVDRALGGTKKIWACSLTQIDWLRQGFTGKSLEMLAAYHGFFADAHRALHDADSLLHLLTMECGDGSGTYLRELLERARRPFVRIVVRDTPKDVNRKLKTRSYRWNGGSYFWWKDLDPDDVDAEQAFLHAEVLGGKRWAETREVPAWERFKLED